MTIAQNRDARIPSICYNEPVFLTARYAGNGASAPLAVSGTTKSQITLTRVGAGNYTIGIPTPVGTVQMLDAWVVGPNVGATLKIACVTPITAGATTFTCNVYYQANSTQTDLSTSEELDVDIRLAATQTP
jgi:hypothetical protein